MRCALFEEIGFASRDLFCPTIKFRGIYSVFNTFIKALAVSGEGREMV
jgi:hypothetical protein